MKNVVVRTVDRADLTTARALGDAGVATVHEAYGRRGLMLPEIRPRQRGVRIGGPAVTVLCQAGDNLMIHAAIETLQPGDIMVVATMSPSTDGFFGEQLGTSLMAHGCAGLVIDTGVRDTMELREMGFPVWSRAVHAAGTVKATAGSVNIPVVAGGTAVDPGDVVVADDDGVCVVRKAHTEWVLANANERLDKETVNRARLAAGETTLDFAGLRDLLVSIGVEWVD